jgi:uncharacterized protein (TIGR01777 family)
MRIIISGSSGLIGSALFRSLTSQGHYVSRLVRPGGPIGSGTVLWDPDRAQLDPGAMERFDAVVHLAGENIASERWSDARKERIRRSRIEGTSLLGSCLASLEHPPRVAVFASAVGFYGDHGDEELTEGSRPGKGFLADVTRDWEAASAAIDATPIRAVRLRFGVVLSREGGALPRLLKPFRMGLGGRIGSGRQYMSWISLADAVGVIEFAMAHDGLSGPVNVVAPAAVTNKGFTRILARVLGRPALAVLPAFAARIAFGEMADEMLLTSARAVPEKLLGSGYVFRYPDLEDFLRKELVRAG